MTVEEAKKAVIDLANAEVGYHEKASNANLDDPTVNSGGANWTKYAKDLDALPNFYNAPQRDLDLHVAKIQWAANKVLGYAFFKSKYVRKFDKYMQKYPEVSFRQLLEDLDYDKYDKMD